ncbi:MAG: hypothetical protein EA388_02160 [Nitriliruptor sp.]|nr:MAG: hypothetical protein EA388_02160 [Nitriliruptor sp.]
MKTPMSPTTGTAKPPRRLLLTAVAAAGLLVLAACGPDEPDAPDEPVNGIEEPQPDENDAPDTEEPENGEPDNDTQTDDTTEPDDASEHDGAEDGLASPVERLDGEPSTDEATDDGSTGVVAVTDVRVGTHDGFDRVVFEIEGDGVAGWSVRYVDEATSQGSGEPIEVAGDVTLAVALSNVTLPPELPAEIERWEEERIEAPEGAVINEVVQDTIFEGIQTFFVGLDAEAGFLIDRFEDPQRVVIDVVHD